MPFKRGQKGEGQVGCLVGLVLLLAGLFVAYKMIPIKVKAAEMRQEVVDEAKAAGQHDDRQILETLVSKGEELKLPVTPEDIEINRSAGSIRVEVRYTVPVEFPGYVYRWNFHHKAENPIF